MTCSCSKKSACAHEAGVLYFLDEFPEILEDFNQKNTSQIISERNVEDSLNIISLNGLNIIWFIWIHLI